MAPSGASGGAPPGAPRQITLLRDSQSRFGIMLGVATLIIVMDVMTQAAEFVCRTGVANTATALRWLVYPILGISRT